ncbi:MAG: diacylglycerol kinase family protein [Bacteroidota bacterium]|nr:diacylglycerol kinase family protein [Bacteroidota bacterium]
MQKWLNSVRYASKGLIYLVRRERNLQIEILLAFLSIGFGFWLQISTLEWSVILLCIGVVIASEAINTAIEKLSDRITTEQDVRIGHIKDLAAGGVLIVAFISLVIGILIFYPHLAGKFL